ncbi:AMP-binding protein [Rhodococcus fascians]|uniref:class I adenylate-forming enzyme family protein n=1 Tax=Rhodococcoides fascians TaxID=1828 RepID=UPI0024B83D14|nr:AMP-binding protein [Rhodococcus fascians]MDJ0005840.1 AMP-binding protein [Rhodococcus fascians]
MLASLLAAAPPTFRIEDGTGSFEASTINDWARTAETHLRDSGIRPGDRVIATVGRTARDIASLIGAQNAGAIVAPVDENTPARRKSAIAENCNARFHLTWHNGDAVADRINRAGTAADDSHAAHLAGSLMIYTSGSSGAPKGIVCPAPAVEFAIHSIQRCLQYDASDLIAQPLPLTFDYGLYQIWLAMVAGARVKLYPDGTAGPTFLTRLDRDRITVLPSMPVLTDSLIRVSERRGRTLSDLRLVTSTGGACSGRQVAGLRRLAPHAHVVPMYGLTECKRATISALGASGEGLGAGRALPDTDVRVRANRETDLPAGETGEIHVGGPHVMAGYWPLSDNELNQRFYTDEYGTRWVATGDSGHLDSTGVLHVEGRLDDVFKSNGYRTSATEVEDALQMTDGVDQACVVPPRSGTPYTAVYVGISSPEDVRRELHQVLESAKHPPYLIPLTDMPLNVNGKIDRPAVARLVAEMGFLE